jgi:hypothetical protein
MLENIFGIATAAAEQAATTAAACFKKCSNLETVNLNVPLATDLGSCFLDCGNLKMAIFNFDSLTDTKYIFRNCSKLLKVEGSVSSLIDNNAIDSGLFEGLGTIKTAKIQLPNLSGGKRLFVTHRPSGTTPLLDVESIDYIGEYIKDWSGDSTAHEIYFGIDVTQQEWREKSTSLSKEYENAINKFKEKGWTVGIVCSDWTTPEAPDFTEQPTRMSNLYYSTIEEDENGNYIKEDKRYTLDILPIVVGNINNYKIVSSLKDAEEVWGLTYDEKPKESEELEESEEYEI